MDMPPLHWTKQLDRGSELRNLSEQDGRRTVAIVTCVNGHACGLSVPPHTVSAEGVVSPSLQCPVDGCSGHEPAGSVLEGWPG